MLQNVRQAIPSTCVLQSLINTYYVPVQFQLYCQPVLLGAPWQVLSSKMSLGININFWWGALVVAAACGCLTVVQSSNVLLGDHIYKKQGCNITFGDHTYREEILMSGIEYPQGLAVDYSTRSLYFTFYNESWCSAKLDLRSNSFSVIEELIENCEFTVDQEQKYVHAGCGTGEDSRSGLYQLDSTTSRFKLVGEAGQNICFVHDYNGTLLYSFHTELLVRTLAYGPSFVLSPPTSEVRSLVVDAQGDFIFNNLTGIYRRRGDSGKETKNETFQFLVWALAVDSSGSTYVCDTGNRHGIWRLDDSKSSTRLKVYCTGLSFDVDGSIIYGDLTRNSILRLVKC